MDSHARTERISQGTDRTEKNLHDIYEDASVVARGVFESMQTLAGTTSCKGVQIAALEKWAKEKGFWIDKIYGM